MRSIVYDKVYSLGQWCVSAMTMKKAGLRSETGPVDWNGPVPGIVNDVALYVEIFLTEFANYFKKENIVRVGENVKAGKAYYDDVKGCGIGSRHDFDLGLPFDEMFAKTRVKYDRRIARFLATMKVPGKYLFVHYVGEGHYDRAKTLAAWERFRAKYPESTLDLLVVETELFKKDLSWEKVAPGVDFVVGDFYDQTRYDAVVGNQKLFLSVLKGVRAKGKLKNLLWLQLDALKKKLGLRKKHA